MKGALIVNLGSPNSPTPKDVKPYLDQFLMDKYVIDVPYLLRVLLVRGIILRTRPKKSAEAYSRIWTDEGSPLIVKSYQMFNKVKSQVNIPVELAMRYGNPSIEQGMKKLATQGVNEMFILPLYPQYAMASTKTIEEKAKELQQSMFPDMKLTFLPAFYNKEEYINVLAKDIKSKLDGYDYDHLLFSYHGIPERHIRKTDVTKSHCKMDKSCCVTSSPAHEFCYKHQCHETTRQVVELLNIPEGKYSQTYQSRLAGDKWLDPYTDKEINKMPNKGIKNLAVVTPAFVTDCLETLEEIDMEAREEFLHHGGEVFKSITCLNDNDEWCKVVATWINKF